MKLSAISKLINLSFALLALVSCGDSAKLNQSEAKNADNHCIKKNSSQYLGRQAAFKQEPLIYSTDPIQQLNEAEANMLANFNFRDAYARENLALKTTCKCHLDNQWLLAASEEVAEVGSPKLAEKVCSCQSLSIFIGDDDL